MIKLKNIVKTNEQITCDAFIENCTESLSLAFNVKNMEFKDYTLPKGYEWCGSHIHHAKRYLISLIEENKIPSERTIMWY